MDARQLEVFVAVAEERSFTRAARRLFSAQSTVSASVRSLESELGSPLFARSTRAVELTGLGEATLTDARAALEAIERMRRTAAPGPTGLRGQVRMGVFTSPGPVDLPEVLGRFHREHPLVRLRLEASPSGSTGLLEDVRRGRLDIALVGLPEPQLSDLAPLLLGSADYVALLPPGHPLAARDRLSLGLLAAEPFVDSPAGFGNRVFLDRGLKAAGVERQVAAEVADLVSIARYVANGLGVAAIPAIIDPGPGVVVVPLTDVPTWNYYAVSGAAARRTAAVAALLDALRSAIPEVR